MKKIFLTFVLALCATTLFSQNWDKKTISTLTAHIKANGQKLSDDCYKLVIAKNEFLLLTGKDRDSNQILTIKTTDLQANLFLNRSKGFAGNSVGGVLFPRILGNGTKQIIEQLGNFLKSFAENPPFPPLKFKDCDNLSMRQYWAFLRQLVAVADTTTDGYSLITGYKIGTGDYSYALVYSASADTITVNEIVQIQDQGNTFSIEKVLVIDLNFEILEAEIRISPSENFKKVTSKDIQEFFYDNKYFERALVQKRQEKGE